MQLGSRDNLHSSCKKAGCAEERGKDERMSSIILDRRETVYGERNATEHALLFYGESKPLCSVVAYA